MMSVAPIQDEQSAANCETAVGKSATERVPVEIWQKILSIAISCALLPRDDDDFFQRRQVDSLGCSKIVEYVNSEKVRTNLRLVCRSWGAFLDLHSDRLVFLSWRVPSGHWPPVKNWDHVVRIVGPNFMLCSCKSQCPAARVRTPSNIELHERISVIRGCLRLLGNRCEAIVVPSPFTGDLVDPERFGSVKMFIGGPFDSETIPPTYRWLTHLRMFVTSICHPSFRLHLPQLTTLTVSFFSNFSKHPANPADIGHWDLPILRCITLIAFPKEESVYYLLQQVGQRITECHIIPVGSTGALVSNSIWRYLPELRVFGVSFEQLVALCPPAGLGPRSINVLVHWNKSQTTVLPEDHAIALFQRNWSSWTVGELTIDASWTELIQNGDMCQGLSDVMMFDILNGIAGGLRDRDRVLFEPSIRDQLRAVVGWRREGP